MFSIFLLIFLSNNAASEDLPVLELTQGKIQGSIRSNLFGDKFYAFQGIPYAQPPIGALRFKVKLPLNVSGFYNIYNPIIEIQTFRIQNPHHHGTVFGMEQKKDRNVVKSIKQQVLLLDKKIAST